MTEQKIKIDKFPALPIYSDYEGLAPSSAIEDKLTGKVLCESLGVEMDGITGTIDKIESGCSLTHFAEDTEMVFLMRGAIKVITENERKLGKQGYEIPLEREYERFFVQKEAFALPKREEFELKVISEEAAEYIRFYPKPNSRGSESELLELTELAGYYGFRLRKHTF